MWTRLQRRNGWCPKKKSDGSQTTNQRPTQRNGGCLILNIFDKFYAGLTPFFFFFFHFHIEQTTTNKSLIYNYANCSWNENRSIKTLCLKSRNSGETPSIKQTYDFHFLLFVLFLYDASSFILFTVLFCCYLNRWHWGQMEIEYFFHFFPFFFFKK